MKSENYPAYFRTYIDKVPENVSPKILLENNINETIKSLAMVSDDKANEGYEKGKWSIKEVLQHIIDTERIFCYRALSIARKESQKLLGFDQDPYVMNSHANQRSLKSILEELKRLRMSTIDLFNSLTEDAMKQVGSANGVSVTPEKIQYILIGHEIHHRQIIEERYLR